MNDQLDLPPGSRFVTSGEFNEYRLDIYVQPDGLIHSVVHSKMQGPDGNPILAKFMGRSHDLACAAIGRPADRYSVEN